MKLNTFAVLSFLACFLLAVSPVASASPASDDTEVYVVALDYVGNSFYMKSLGGGQFEPQDFLGNVGGTSYGNGIGDFDNDGDLDYIIGSTGSPANPHPIYLYEKVSPGKQFNPPVPVGNWGEGLYPMDIVVADFVEDGNGNLDFVLVKWNNTDCELFTGDGQGGFTSSVQIDTDTAPRYAVGADAADFNNDGHADFVVAPYSSHDDFRYFYVNLGNGDGTFTTVEVRTHPSPLNPGQTTTYWGVAAGDFDGDGKADLVATTKGYYDIYFGFESDGIEGTFDRVERISDPKIWIYAPVDNYDFNGDQIQDIVIGRYGSANGVGYLTWDGNKRGFKHLYTYYGGTGGERFAISAPPYEQNKSPVAIVDPDYQEITAGETVFFSAEESYDDDGDIVLYSWDFGEKGLLKSFSSNEGSSAEHVFYQEGLYTITLTVIDDKGATNSVEATVRVNPLEAAVRITPKTLNLKSQGKWVQATIWLPYGYDASQIDLNSVCIVENKTPMVYAHADYKWRKFKKYHKNKRVRKLRVKFDRQALLAALSGPAGVKTLHVRGVLNVQDSLSQRTLGSVSFEGSGTIRTIEPRKKVKPEKKDGDDEDDKRNKKKKKS
jgi:hypothetical protein